VLPPGNQAQVRAKQTPIIDDLCASVSSAAMQLSEGCLVTLHHQGGAGELPTDRAEGTWSCRCCGKRLAMSTG
jgi:hypothetical protein